VIREVEKPVEVIKEVEKIVEVPVEVLKEIEVEIIKEVEIEKIIEVPVEIIKEVEIEKIIEQPIEIIKEVLIEKIVEVPVYDKEPILLVEDTTSSNGHAIASEESDLPVAAYGYSSLSYELFSDATKSSIDIIDPTTEGTLGAGNYYFWKGSDDLHYFALTKEDGQIVLFSDGFTSQRVRKNAFKYILSLLYRLENYRPYANPEGGYYFHFYGNDGEIYGSSPSYASQDALDDSINYLATNNPRKDDLKLVEGIGPKIESLLYEAGIQTWEALANTPAEQIKEILDQAGSRYRMHNPSTWPMQAALAHEGKWKELKDWQDELHGGKA